MQQHNTHRTHTHSNTCGIHIIVFGGVLDIIDSICKVLHRFAAVCVCVCAHKLGKCSAYVSVCCRPFAARFGGRVCVRIVAVLRLCCASAAAHTVD